jgi:hypothetical protein
MSPRMAFTDRKRLTKVALVSDWYVRGRTPFREGFSSSIAAIASLMALPRLSPSFNTSRFAKRDSVGRYRTALAW